MSELILPKIAEENFPPSNKSVKLSNTMYKISKNNSFKLNDTNSKISTVVNDQAFFNKTCKSFNTLLTKVNKLEKYSPEYKILKTINFIKNPILDKEIERLQYRHINDQIFTTAVKNFSFDKRNREGLIRGVNRKKTIYSLNLQGDKENKKESFILKDYFPIYLPDINLKKNQNEKNKHYSRNIIKNLNNRLFSLFSQDDKAGDNFNSDLNEKKFEEEVKKYQLSKIIQLNNLKQNNDNIVIINSVEDLEKNNFEENIGQEQLFYIRENNFALSEIPQKLESDQIKRNKSKELNLFNRTKYLRKKKIKEKYNLFDKKYLKNKNSLEINEILNFELNIYYCQNLSTSNRNKEGIEGINQDSYMQLFNIKGNSKFHLFGVMDGHGINGHIISKFISRYIEDYFISEKFHKLLGTVKNNKEIYNLLTQKKYSFINNLIKECNNSLIYNSNYECDFSGATCLLIFIIGNNLICANIGNSRAILLERTELLQLSIDQTLNDPEEIKRVINKGGKIKKIKKKIFLDYEGLDDNFEISRSIGDKNLKNIGIICEPVITEYTLSKKSRFLIMSTQGLWKGLSNEKAAIQVNKSIKLHNPLDCCRLLEAKAEDTIFRSTSFRDDITTITLIFEDALKVKNEVYE